MLCKLRNYTLRKGLPSPVSPYRSFFMTPLYRSASL